MLSEDGALYELLQDLIDPELPLELPDKMATSSSDQQLDWDVHDVEGRLASSHMQASVAEMATFFEEWLGNAEGSEDIDEVEERSDVSSP